MTLLEPAGGTPMRRWSWDRELPAGEDGALFRYLRHGQRSVTDASAALARRRATSCSPPDPRRTAPRTRSRPHTPDLVVVSLTPYGLTGPYADRPATEFTVQADSGAVAIRGTADRPPFQMGGRIVEWVAGAYAAVGALASAPPAHRAPASGDLLDVSLCEVANLTGTNFADLVCNSLAGRPPLDRPARTVETPVDRADRRRLGRVQHQHPRAVRRLLPADRAPRSARGRRGGASPTRQERADEWNAHRPRVDHAAHDRRDRRAGRAAADPGRAGLRRRGGPRGLEQAIARGVFVRRSRPARSAMPRRPWTIDGEPAPAAAAGPVASGSTTASHLPARSRDPAADASPARPSRWTASRSSTSPPGGPGPSATGLLAALGADVVHVESIRAHGRHAHGRRHVLRPRAVVGVQRVLPAGQHEQARRHARPRHASGSRARCCD